jgi:hypothetical protein
MPVDFVNASMLGWLPLESTSMYSGQFDQLTTFSVADLSTAAFGVGLADPAPEALALRPGEPQAASSPVAATPASPAKAERRERAARERDV